MESKFKGRQHPMVGKRGLYELLTDEETLRGLVVEFDCGLRYTVGEGWTGPRGGVIAPAAAHRKIRRWWHAQPWAKPPRRSCQ